MMITVVFVVSHPSKTAKGAAAGFGGVIQKVGQPAEQNPKYLEV
jgi:hypothetical protein